MILDVVFSNYFYRFIYINKRAFIKIYYLLQRLKDEHRGIQVIKISQGSIKSVNVTVKYILKYNDNFIINYIGFDASNVIQSCPASIQNQAHQNPFQIIIYPLSL